MTPFHHVPLSIRCPLTQSIRLKSDHTLLTQAAVLLTAHLLDRNQNALKIDRLQISLLAHQSIYFLERS